MATLGYLSLFILGNVIITFESSLANIFHLWSLSQYRVNVNEYRKLYTIFNTLNEHINRVAFE